MKPLYLVLLSILLPGSVAASGPASSGSSPRKVMASPSVTLQVINQHLKVMYPELSRRRSYMFDTNEPDTWHVIVNQEPPPHGYIRYPFWESSTPCAPISVLPKSACALFAENEEPALRAMFRVTPNGEYFYVGSTLKASAANQAFKDLLASHPQWTDEEKRAELKRRGARFGPNQKQELLHSETLKRLRLLIGPYTIKKAEFLWTTTDRPSGKTITAAYWRVEMRVPKRYHHDYIAIVEPMAGEITSLYFDWYMVRDKNGYYTPR